MSEKQKSYLLTLALCCAFGVLLFFAAESMIFQPPQPPGYQTNDPDIVSIQHLHALWLKNPKAKATILYSHGNASDIGFDRYTMQRFYEHGYNVLDYDYSGYGHSGGSPSEQQAYRDSEAAYDFLTGEQKISPKNIIAMGHSLGAAMAIHLANHRPVAGIVLIAPFVTAARVVTHIPLLPWDYFDNLSAIKTVKVPILLVHGTADTTIASWHSKKLLAAATTAEKSLFIVPEHDHDNIVLTKLPSYWQRLHQFIAKCVTYP
jgi:abhydrolase domain-containing protein 17